MKPKVLVIGGPTASGKKRISLKLADRFNGEIVSADSRKIYRYLDIGTAKPSEEDRKVIPHHLIDIVDPDEPFSAGDWTACASKAVNDIHARGKLPILSGGTGFYLKAFMEGLSEGISSDPYIREQLERELDASGGAAMHRKLGEIDPVRAAELHENDTVRILRALEIWQVTGKTFTEMRNFPKITGGEYGYFYLGVTRNRTELYRTIDIRAEKMMSAGLLNEIKSVLGRGYTRDLTSLDTVGYKEWFSYLDGERSYESCFELMKRNTRRYAKRQLTWFRAQPGIRWIDAEKPDEMELMLNDIEQWLIT